MAGAISYYDVAVPRNRQHQSLTRDSAYWYNNNHKTNNKDDSTFSTSTRPRCRSYCNRPLPPLPVSTMGKRSCSISVPPSKRPLSHFLIPSPTLLPKEQVNPLSLQDTCFLKILSYVDHYPVQTLGMLPLPWRRKLIATLPPFRLFQLEKTCIGDNIDTEAVWEELSTLKNNIWGCFSNDRRHQKQQGGGKNQGCTSFRDGFINYLSYLLLNEMNRDYACKRITELLHAIHIDTLDKSVANALIYGHINSMFMFIPPYCLIPFRCPNLTERELYWSLIVNRMLPKSLDIYAYNLDASPLWNQGAISQEMLRRLLSKLQHLKLYNHKNETEQIKQVTNAITHSSRYKEPPSGMGSLTNLEILRADDQHIAAIAPYFSEPNGYSNLTSLTISMIPLRYVQATMLLRPLIKNQLGTLQYLHLEGISCCITRNVIHFWDYMFFNLLSTFVLKQRFRTLVLSKFKQIPWMLVQTLLEANLRTVPCHKQKLVFREGNIIEKGELPFTDVEDDEGEGEENQFYPAYESKCLENKYIHFENVSLPVDLLNWFEKTERLCVHTLEFNRVNVSPNSVLKPKETSRRLMTRHGMFRRKAPPFTSEALKKKFVAHLNFQCRMFLWNEVVADNQLINV